MSVKSTAAKRSAGSKSKPQRNTRQQSSASTAGLRIDGARYKCGGKLKK